MPPLLAELPCGDGVELFERLRGLPWPVFLDSASAPVQGRFHLLCADPAATLVTRGAITELRDAGGALTHSAADPFLLVRQALGETAPALQTLPFAGGAVGWFAYDLARRLETLPEIAQDLEHLPDMAVGIYDWAVVVDRQENRAWLASHARYPRTRQNWAALVERLSSPAAATPGDPFRLGAAPASNLSYAAYASALARIKHYIREGDCYQVNFAQRFAAPASGDPWPAYKALRTLNPAPFGAYLETPFASVLSTSPERFLSLRNGHAETRPIKGTRPRAAGPAEDARLAKELAGSSKDRAENVMIVDLLRNDLGKVCRAVKTPRLFEVESYATVHHLVSTVTGELLPGTCAADLLRACFPGGSITGAPKKRAMEIIEELEPARRGLYCGSIAWIGFDGAMDSNIAIRTLVYSDGEIRFWAGGGIVHDSDIRQEYEETLHKAAALLHWLNGYAPHPTT